MTKKPRQKPAARRESTDLRRRRAVKALVAGGVGLLASPWMFQTGRAQGRAIKIGFVSPQTGPIAAFGEADGYIVDGVRRALRDGLTINGVKHPVTIVVKDSQSLVDAGLYPTMSDDFSRQIAMFKAQNVEILTGVFVPPAFATFWAQAAQQGFRPKVCSIAKALLFPPSVEALGERGGGLSTEVWWSPSHPYKSGLTGQTSAELAAGYTQASGRQWTQPLGFKHAGFEVVCDVLRRTKIVGDPKSIRDAIKETNYQSIVGPVRWTDKPMKNVTTTPLVGGQWKRGSGRKYELVVVNNNQAPQIPVGGKFEPIAY